MADTIRKRPKITRNPLLDTRTRQSQEIAGVSEDVAGVPWGEPGELADDIQEGKDLVGKTATGMSYEHITEQGRLEEYCRGLAERSGPVAIDFETTDLRPRFAALVGIAVAESDQHGVYISGKQGIDLPKALGLILAACKTRQLVAYNAVYELSVAAHVLGADHEASRHFLGANVQLQSALRDWSPEILDNIELGREPSPRMVERAVLRSLTGIQDPMIMARLAGYEYNIGLKDQAAKHFNVHMTEITALIGKGAKQITMAEVDPDDAAPYAADDVIWTMALFPLLRSKLPRSVQDVYDYIEVPLLPVSAAMGLSGMELDGEAIERAKSAVEKRIEELNNEIQAEFQAAIVAGTVTVEEQPDPIKKDPTRKRPVYRGTDGRIIGPPASLSYPRALRWEYNPGSNKQAPAFLGLPDSQASTYELSGMPLALKHRDLDHFRKLLSSYIAPVERMLLDGKGGYFSLNQAGTGTGRFSASGWKLRDGQWGINAQTKPKPKGNEDPKDPNTESKLIGRQFSAGQGNYFVEIDYSQIELRVEAHRAPEENMIAAYNAGRDLHDEMMARSGLKDRRLAKVANFGCSYEDNDWTASGVVKRNAAKSDILISNEAAMETVKAFREAWPGLAAYYAEIHARIKKFGFVETLFGRRLYRKYVPYPYPKPKYAEEPSKNDFDMGEPDEAAAYHEAFAQWMTWKEWKDVDKINAARRREAINMPIQGSAADILKRALVMLWLTLPDWAEIVLTVHDSILFRCPKDKVKELCEWAMPIMESEEIIKMAVPLKVEAEAGPNWADLKEIG